MKIKIELNEATLRTLVVNHIQLKLGAVNLDPRDVLIEVRSKQNFKSEWEGAEFRATYNKVTDK